MKRILAFTLSLAMLLVAGCTSKADNTASETPSLTQTSEPTASNEQTEEPVASDEVEKTAEPQILADASGKTGNKISLDGEGVEIKGNYFTVIMPGDAEVESEVDDESGTPFKITTYMHESTNGKEAYVIVEMEWSELVDMIVSLDPKKEMQVEMMEEMISSIAGESIGVVDVGDMKGFELDEAAKEDFNVSTELGSDAQVDICVVPSDQALFVIMYGALGDSYNEDSRSTFFDSFKGVGITIDYMDASVAE